jgi:hypothetical protein
MTPLTIRLSSTPIMHTRQLHSPKEHPITPQEINPTIKIQLYKTKKHPSSSTQKNKIQHKLSIIQMLTLNNISIASPSKIKTFRKKNNHNQINKTYPLKICNKATSIIQNAQNSQKYKKA